METIKISMDVVNDSRARNLALEAWIDDQLFFDNLITPGRHHVLHESHLADGSHRLQLVLKQKTQENTRVDDDGIILSDDLLRIQNLRINDLDMEQLIWNNARYIHDGNGSHKEIVDEFFGDMGCNGRVELEFDSPFYLWFLENV
jgi:hypothetical protein